MANRVNININVRDLSQRALRSFNQNVNRLSRSLRSIPNRINTRVNLRAPNRGDIRRIMQSMRRGIGNVRSNVLVRGPSNATLIRIQRRLGRTVTVPLRVTGRGLRASIVGPLRSLQGLASGIMQDGIGQGIVNGFKAGGPIGIAFLANALLALAAIVGAALSGLLVTALGAAFVGIGVASAAMSDQIKSEWSDTLGRLKELFADVGTPLIPVLSDALFMLEKMAERAAPALKKALEDTAPATEAFIQGLMRGFESFGQGAFDRIMEAWNVFAPVFGEEWDEFMGQLGDAFGDMADLVKQHPTEIAMALDIVFTAIELLVRTVTFLGDVWVAQLRFMTSSVGYLAKAAASFLDGFLGVMDGMLAGLEMVAEPLGMAGPFKTARENLEGFRSQAVEKLNAIGQAGINFGLNLDRANKKRKLEADIASWQNKLSTARASLKKTTDQKARAKLTANIDDLNNKIANAKAKLASLNGRTATTYVRTVDLGIGAEAANAARRATGGVIGTAATGGVRNNLTLVGEAGPELVSLPGGSHVRSNPDTRRIMNRGGQGGGVATLMIDAAGDDTSQFLLRILRRAIRVQGGDVQVVLGRG